jgi:hypothetical protein
MPLVLGARMKIKIKMKIKHTQESIKTHYYKEEIVLKTKIKQIIQIIHNKL